MKILFLFLGLTFSLSQLIAQCPINTETTEGEFDWKNETYNIYLRVTETKEDKVVPFRSPFYSHNNRNVGHLDVDYPNGDDARDYLNSDGWEFVYKDFEDNGTGQGIQHPTLVMYNRHTSVIRIFVAISDRETSYNSAFIKLRVLDPIVDAVEDKKRYSSANMSFADSRILSLDTFNNKESFTRLQAWEEQDSYWLYADFPIAYDPCVCNYHSMLEVTVSLINQGTFNINLNGATYDKDYLKQEGQNDMQKVISNIEAGASHVMGFFGSANEAVGWAKKLLFPERKVTEAITFGANGDNVFSRTIVKQPKAGLLNAIPFIAGAFGVMDFIVSGGFKDNQTITPTAYLGLKGSGTIDFENAFKTVRFVNPGAKKGLASNAQLPVYNNLLGIFNLLETPVLEYNEYSPLGVHLITISTDPNGPNSSFVMPKIREYRLKNDIKYVFNEASNFEIVNIEAAIFYGTTIRNRYTEYDCFRDDVYVSNKFLHGPVEFGLLDNSVSYAERLSKTPQKGLLYGKPSWGVFISNKNKAIG
jgi:hypothetical protein